MPETIEERMERQFKNYQWRHGRGARETDLVWGYNYRDAIIGDQALDKRSQFEWFAEAEYSDPRGGES